MNRPLLGDIVEDQKLLQFFLSVVRWVGSGCFANVIA